MMTATMTTMGGGYRQQYNHCISIQSKRFFWVTIWIEAYRCLSERLTFKTEITMTASSFLLPVFTLDLFFHFFFATITAAAAAVAIVTHDRNHVIKIRAARRVAYKNLFIEVPPLLMYTHHKLFGFFAIFQYFFFVFSNIRLETQKFMLIEFENV